MLAARRALAVTRSGRPVPGAIETFPVERIDEIWPLADHFVISATATLDVEQLVGATELAAMKSTAWVVNVARGDLVDTDASSPLSDPARSAARGSTSPIPNRSPTIIRCGRSPTP